MLAKQVHQHGFAAPDAAVDIDAFGRLDRLGEEAGEKADLADGIGFEPVFQALQLRQDGLLRRVRAQATGSDKIGIDGFKLGSHEHS